MLSPESKSNGDLTIAVLALPEMESSAVSQESRGQHWLGELSHRLLQSL